MSDDEENDGIENPVFDTSHVTEVPLNDWPLNQLLQQKLRIDGIELSILRVRSHVYSFLCLLITICVFEFIFILNKRRDELLKGTEIQLNLWLGMGSISFDSSL